MADLLDGVVLGEVRAPGDQVTIALRIPVDGSGDPTTASFYNGAVTVTHSSGNYTIDVGRFASLAACVAVNGAGEPAGPIVADGAAGTVEIQHTSGPASTTIDAIIVVNRN